MGVKECVRKPTKMNMERVISRKSKVTCTIAKRLEWVAGMRIDIVSGTPNIPSTDVSTRQRKNDSRRTARSTEIKMVFKK